MRIFFISTLAFTICLGSCAKRGVEILASPVSNLAIVHTTYNPDLQSASTIGTLKKENLFLDHSSQPDQARRALIRLYRQNPTPERRLALAELLSDAGGRIEESNPNRAAGLLLDAASLTYRVALASAEVGEDRDVILDRVIHKNCVGKLTRVLHRNRDRLSFPHQFPGELRTYTLGLAQGKGYARPDDFDSLIPAALLKFKGINWKHRKQDGFGVAFVGHKETTEELMAKDPMVPLAGFGTALNASMRFSGSRATLVLQNLMKKPDAFLGGQKVTLAGDFTAPLVYLYRNEKKEDTMERFLGLLWPGNYESLTRLFSLEPFNKDKIPLILVHGLMSNAQMWMPFIDHVRNDPVIRARYQIITFNYPSGNSIARNASELREALRKMREFYDPSGKNPNLRKMVIVGHSMGGILSNMQIRDSGDRLVRTYFTGSIDDLNVDLESKKFLRKIGVFEANPDIRRAVFIATPHRGSPIASNPIGQFGASLIRLPFTVLDSLTEDHILMNELTEVGQQAMRRSFNSINALRPDNPSLATVLEMPVKKGVHVHSIIGQAITSMPTLKGSDLAVAYTSSHLDNVDSEKIVLGVNHSSVVESEETIRELWRILYLHAGVKMPAKAR